MNGLALAPGEFELDLRGEFELDLRGEFELDLRGEDGEL